jgi:hypothetical protein
MGLIPLLIAVVIIALVVWVIETLLPLPAPFQMIVRVIAVIIVLVLLLQFLGLVASGGLVWRRP